MSQLYILFICLVNPVASFGGFQIDKSHFRVVANCFPEDLALIVAKVYAVNMRTGVFALYINALRHCQSNR